MFLEKYSYHGKTLDVLVFHLETERIRKTVSQDKNVISLLLIHLKELEAESDFKCIEVCLEQSGRKEFDIFSETNDFIQAARQEGEATVLLMDK